jgi:hypothetical protein
MAQLSEDQLKKVVVHSLLKYGNDFAEEIQGKNVSAKVQEQADAILIAARQYAEEREAKAFDRGVQASLDTIANFDDTTPRVREAWYKVKELKPDTYGAARLTSPLPTPATLNNRGDSTSPNTEEKTDA